MKMPRACFMRKKNHNIRTPGSFAARAETEACYASRMRLGDYIDDYCTRCKLTTDHAVVSMFGDEVKITRCRTCDSEHKYRHNKGSKEMTNKQAFDAVMASVLGAHGASQTEDKPKRRKKT